MTVKELKDKLNQFPDYLIVMIPNEENPIGYAPTENVARGCNEADGCLFIDDYTEDDE